MALGQAVDGVVQQQEIDVDVTAQRMQQMVAADGEEIAVAANNPDIQIRIGYLDAGCKRPTVPAPNELSAEEYGAALGVPVFEPARGYTAQHFFYALSDDLDLLHEFLVNGIERVGQWKTVSGTALADKLCSRSISSQEITFRSDLLEVFCELWKQGRGRPVDREALENSGALSERFLDDVVVIADELGGDPEKLLTALGSQKDPRLKGFRKNSLENLERYLRENVYLDEQPVFAENELRLRALASPAANQLPEGTADECLNSWWTLAERANEPDAQ